MKEWIATVFADAHCDNEVWTGSGMFGDSHYALQQIVDYVQKNNGPLTLIGAGDLLDTKKPSSSTISFLRTILNTKSKAHNAPYSWWFIEGQHDMTTPPWWSAVSKNAVHINKQLRSLGGLNVYGLNWQPATLLQSQLDEIPKNTDILVCHQVWEEFMGSITSPEGSIRNVPYGKMVITGDYHKTELTSVKRIGNKEKITILSPGATHMRSSNEPEEHFFFKLYDDMSLGKVRLKSRPVFDLYVTNDTQLDMALAEASKTREVLEATDFNKILLRVQYAPDMLQTKKMIEEQYADFSHIFWKPLIGSEEDNRQVIEISQAVRKAGAAGCLKEVMPEDDPRFKPLTQLLLSKDYKQTLLDMKKERGLCD